MEQREIKEKTRLLNDDGTLYLDGYGKHNYFDYEQDQIGRRKWRFKEWNYYQISDGKWMLQLNIFNIGLATCLSVSMVNLRTGKRIDDGSLELFTAHKNHLDTNGEMPSVTEYSFGGRFGRFEVTEEGRRLTYKGNWRLRPVEIDLKLEHLPEHESLVTCTPFEKKHQFFLTQKMNCMPVSGYVKIGRKRYNYTADKAFAVMDWGRGIWPYSNGWYWANGSSRIDGKAFGFELTWGFGDTTNVTATALFYDGKCHKIDEVYLESDPEVGNAWMKPWHFLSKDGRLDLVMNPYYHHDTGAIVFGLAGMKSHQVHGLWSGTVILDDGTVLEIKDMYAFCEKVKNKW